MESLSMLDGMDHLRTLVIARQPMSSPQGAEKLTALESVRFIACENLWNIAPVFENPELLAITVDHCAQFSSLEIYQPSEELKNLSELTKCDFSYVNESGEGFVFGFEGEKIQLFRFFENIRLFRSVRITDSFNSRWRAGLKDSKVLGLEIRDIRSQALLENVLSDHPELENLTLDGCGKLRDLGVLADMPKLKKLIISKDGRSLISTLDNRDYDFTIEVR